MRRHEAANPPAQRPASERRLVAVLTNPPTTSGVRTTARLHHAGEILGVGSLGTVNLFALPTTSSVQIASEGLDIAGWADARAAILDGLTQASDVLLPYGLAEPTGPARGHFRAQVAWLNSELAPRGLRVRQVGDGPRHPSRWQRWTHRAYPGLDFRTALGRAMVPWPGQPVTLSPARAPVRQRGTPAPRHRDGGTTGSDEGDAAPQPPR